jgi:hypothetical protein
VALVELVEDDHADVAQVDARRCTEERRRVRSRMRRWADGGRCVRVDR